MVGSFFKFIYTCRFTLALLVLAPASKAALIEIADLCSSESNLNKVHSMLIDQTNRINTTALEVQLEKHSVVEGYAAACCVALDLDFKTATLSSAKTAYRKLSLKNHPDKLSGTSQIKRDVCEEIFKIVTQAYTYLTSYFEYQEQLKTRKPSSRPGTPEDLPSYARAAGILDAYLRAKSPKSRSSQPTAPKKVHSPRPASATRPPARKTEPKASQKPARPPQPHATSPRKAPTPTKTHHATPQPKPHTTKTTKKTAPAPPPLPRTKKRSATATSKAHKTSAPIKPSQRRKAVPPLNTSGIHQTKWQTSFTYKHINGCWWITLRGQNFMLVDNQKRFRFPALVKDIKGNQTPATFADHKDKFSKLIPFPLYEAERIAVFCVLLQAKILQKTILNALSKDVKNLELIKQELEVAASLIQKRRSAI